MSVGNSKTTLAAATIAAFLAVSTAAWSQNTVKDRGAADTAGRSAHDIKAEQQAQDKGAVHSGPLDKPGRAAHEPGAESHQTDQHVGTQGATGDPGRGDHAAQHRGKKAKKKTAQPTQ